MDMSLWNFLYISNRASIYGAGPCVYNGREKQVDVHITHAGIFVLIFLVLTVKYSNFRKFNETPFKNR